MTDIVLPEFVAFPSIKRVKRGSFISEKIDGCLHQNTLVILEDKTEVPIKNIKPGDKVLSFNTKTNKFESKKVKNILVRDKTTEIPWLKVVLKNGREIICTENHPFLTNNRGWVEANKLLVTDDLVDY